MTIQELKTLSSTETGQLTELQNILNDSHKNRRQKIDAIYKFITNKKISPQTTLRLATFHESSLIPILKNEKFNPYWETYIKSQRFYQPDTTQPYQMQIRKDLPHYQQAGGIMFYKLYLHTLESNPQDAKKLLDEAVAKWQSLPAAVEMLEYYMNRLKTDYMHIDREEVTTLITHMENIAKLHWVPGQLLLAITYYRCASYYDGHGNGQAVKLCMKKSYQALNAAIRIQEDIKSITAHNKEQAQLSQIATENAFGGKTNIPPRYLFEHANMQELLDTLSNICLKNQISLEFQTKLKPQQQFFRKCKPLLPKKLEKSPHDVLNVCDS